MKSQIVGILNLKKKKNVMPSILESATVLHVTFWSLNMYVSWRGRVGLEITEDGG